MAVIRALGVLICLLSLPCVWAQNNEDFVDIDCGAPVGYTDDWNITWKTDDAFVSTGAVGQSTATDLWEELLNCRYFSNSRGKNCYTLPTTTKQTYMLRAEFCYSNYDGLNTALPSFLMAIDSTVVENVTINRGENFNHIRELTFQAMRNVTSLCLLRDQTNSTPFISAISLRPVGTAGVPRFIGNLTSSNQFASTMTRIYFNSSSSDTIPDSDTIVYPQDHFDRYWYGTDGAKTNAYPLSNVGTGLTYSSPLPLEIISADQSTTIDTSTTPLDNDDPQNAIHSAITTSGSLTIPLMAPDSFTALMRYYFVELDETVSITDRPFWITSPGLDPFLINVRDQTGSALSLRIFYDEDALIDPDSKILMTPATDRTNPLKGPMISAMEIFKVHILQVLPTNDRDWNGIEVVKSDMGLASWGGDPCLPVPHDWLSCNSTDSSSEASVLAIGLSGYNLTGAISPGFAALLSVTSLKLDNNYLLGQIPDLRALQNLTSLHLQNNYLNGPLPLWLASLPIQELFVQNNNFSGAIPAEFATKNWNFNYTENPGLVISASPKPNPSASSTPKPKKKTSNIAAIVGVISAVVVLIGAIVGFIVYCCCCRRRVPKDLESSRIVQTENPSMAPNPDVAPRGAREYSLAEVMSATENFKKEIGRGGFGPVFYGTLPDGKQVAVKELDKSSSQGQSEFFNEVDILSTVHHKHLVALVGYCRSPEKQLLIYEFIHKGSLRDHLDEKNSSNTMDWKTRLNIALQAAQGLDYLHTGCNPSLIHRDVKSSNILITSKYEAKVADFGLSRLVDEDGATKVMTIVKGTAGYLDPEYYISHYLTAKSDVYGFGVVLLELLTGRLPIAHTTPNETNANICDWVRSTLEQGNIDAILDPAVRSSHPSHEALWKVAEVALSSVEPKSVHRPTMYEVVQELQGATALEYLPLSQHQHQRMPSEYSDYSMSSQAGLGNSSLPAPG